MKKHRKVRYCQNPTYSIYARRGTFSGISVKDVLVTCKPTFDRPGPVFSLKELNTPRVKNALKQKIEADGDFTFISRFEYLLRKLMGKYNTRTEVLVNMFVSPAYRSKAK